jgi:hypothetical protein
MVIIVGSFTFGITLSSAVFMLSLRNLNPHEALFEQSGKKPSANSNLRRMLVQVESTGPT